VNDPIAKIIAEWLIIRGIGVRPPVIPNPALAWQVTPYLLPEDAPDSRLAVFGTGSEIWAKLQKTNELLTSPTVQYRLRGLDPALVEAKGREIKTAIVNLNSASPDLVTIGATTYEIKGMHIYMDLVPLKREEQNRRWHYSMNVRLTIGVA
jgi:hypothetical protein